MSMDGSGSGGCGGASRVETGLRPFALIARHDRVVGLRTTLSSYQAIINLIASTTTSTGLKVYARLDENHYPTKIKVTDAALAAVNIERHAFHGDWNYIIHPNPKSER